MVKRMLLAFGLVAAATSVIVVQARQDAEAKEQKLMARVEQALDQLPDSMFDRVKTQDLLDDQVYRQLEREGWTRQEIEKIMQTALRDRNTARAKAGYFDYRREWLPYQRLGLNNPNMAANDPDNPGVMLTETTDGAITDGTDGSTTDGTTGDGTGTGTGDGTGGGDLSNGDGNRHDNQEVEPIDPDAAMNSDEFFNKSWPEIPYLPDDRKAGRRNRSSACSTRAISFCSLASASCLACTTPP